FRVLPSDREGTHKIQVATSNGKLSVVARSEFAVPAAPRPALTAERTAAAVRPPRRRETVSSVSVDKIRLRAATHALADTNGAVRIRLIVDVHAPAAAPASALALGYKLAAGDRIVAEDGRVVPVVRDGTGDAAPVSYIAFRNVPPGRYSLRLSAS